MPRDRIRRLEDRDQKQRPPARDQETSDSSGARRSRIDDLHRAVGNQTIQRLHERGDLQARLEVSQPDDEDEREAERVAQQVTGAGPQGPAVGVDRSIQRSGSDGGATLDGDRQRQIESVTNGGEPLSEDARNDFEPRFGRDFGDVRVHTGGEADRAARSIDAEAFTYGSDVVFKSGNYRPDTDQGKELLAHELTHVVQQTGGRRVQRQTNAMVGGGAPVPDVSKSEVKQQLVAEARALYRQGSGLDCADVFITSAIRASGKLEAGLSFRVWSAEKDEFEITSSAEYVGIEQFARDMRTQLGAVNLPQQTERQSWSAIEPGDVFVFDLTDHDRASYTGHTMIVDGVSGDTYTVIEGHTGESTITKDEYTRRELQNKWNGALIGNAGRNLDWERIWAIQDT